MGRIANGVVGIGVGAAAFVGFHEVTNTDFLGENQTNYVQHCAQYLGSSAVTLSELKSYCGLDDFSNKNVSTISASRILSIDLPTPQEYLDGHLAAAKSEDARHNITFNILDGLMASGIAAVTYVSMQQMSKQHASTKASKAV